MFSVLCFYNDWFPLCEYCSSLFKLFSCRWFGGTDHLFFQCDVGPSIARRPTNVINVTSAPALSDVQLVCSISFCLGKSFRLNICLCVLSHYASMHLWLKLFMFRSCDFVVEKIRWINHCLDCIYCCLNIWYHNGFIFGTNLYGHERWYHISAESICYEYW